MRGIELFFIFYFGFSEIMLNQKSIKIAQHFKTLRRNQIHTSIEIKTGLVVDDLCHSRQVLCQQHTPLNIDLNKNSLLHRN